MRESRFRGVKGKVYENGIRVPAVIEWPAGIPEPAVSSISAATSDILPTLCKLAGTKLPNVPLDGIDLVPLLKGNEEAFEPHRLLEFSVETSQDGRPYIDPELQKGTTPTWSNKCEDSSLAISGMIITQTLPKENFRGGAGNLFR